MDILLNPNIAYLILVLGVVFAGLALLIPGTGIPEAASLAALALAGWLALSLGVNYPSLVLLVVGVIFLFLALRKQMRPTYLILAILALVLGSTYLFPGKIWYIPAVNPLLALIVSPTASVFLWFVGRKAMEAQVGPVAHNLQALIGSTGEATTDIFETGTVQLASELWSARSTDLIPCGSQVRIVGREGFTLVVEKI